jgi:hypothetical protein
VEQDCIYEVITASAHLFEFGSRASTYLAGQECELPSSAEGTWPKAGVVLAGNRFLDQHHPVCAYQGCFATSSWARILPLLG